MFSGNSENLKSGLPRWHSIQSLFAPLEAAPYPVRSLGSTYLFIYSCSYTKKNQSISKETDFEHFNQLYCVKFWWIFALTRFDLLKYVDLDVLENSTLEHFGDKGK